MKGSTLADRCNDCSERVEKLVLEEGGVVHVVMPYEPPKLESVEAVPRAVGLRMAEGKIAMHHCAPDMPA